LTFVVRSLLLAYQQRNRGNEMSCCTKPNIFVSDHKENGEIIENRLCLSCKKHWHKGLTFSGKQWDLMMSSRAEYVKAVGEQYA
jgi:hypothetical protein